jgi:sulfate/thiosulfate transport system ATP-binding protein
MSIVLTDLVKRYAGEAVVDHVSLEVEDGEFFVLLGESGSGKSTILRMIAGLASPDEGRIVLHGRDVTDLPPQARNTGFVFQNYSLFRHMTVAENVEFSLRVRKVPRAERAAKRDDLLALVGLAGFARRYPRQLSGGQQQRVAVARALAFSPSVLLLDEPFGALDVKIRGQLRRALRKIQKSLKITTILVTHDQEEAFLFAKHVVVLNEGRVVVAGRPQDVMKHQHPFLQEFVKMVMLHRAEVQRDGDGHYVQVEDGSRIPLALAGIQAGDEVHVMVKKGPDRERFEVWPVGKP